MLSETTYQDNFIKAVRLIMAESAIDTVKDVAEYLGIPYMNLYKIMVKENRPQVDHIITVCLKGGFSPTWLLLDKGSRKMGEVVTLEKLSKRLEKLEQRF